MSIQDLKTEFNKEIKALKKTQPEMKEFNWNFILEQNPFPHMVLQAGIFITVADMNLDQALFLGYESIGSTSCSNGQFQNHTHRDSTY